MSVSVSAANNIDQISEIFSQMKECNSTFDVLFKTRQRVKPDTKIFNTGTLREDLSVET